MKLRIAIVSMAMSLFLQAAQDMRPSFDKTTYKGTVWSQVNPWFPMNKPRDFTPLGGPNYARKVIPGYGDSYNVEAWKEGIRETQKYGMTGWQFELNAASPGFADQFKSVIRAATELGTDFKLSVFLGTYRGTRPLAESKKLIKDQFRAFKDQWLNSPNIMRVDGRPVISVYTPFDFTPAEWQEIMAEFEQEFGPTIWLLNIWSKTHDTTSKAAQIRSYMPYFDGVTAYANWGHATQAELYGIIGKIMREEFPQKIFEGSVHNTYSTHYFHGGVPTRLSEKYRQSWDTMKQENVDSVVMTNLFDHWENSLVLPCYERGDFIMRYAEYQKERLFGKAFRMSQSPELVLTNYIDMLPHARKMEFEIIAFPTANPVKAIQVGLEITGDNGKVIHTFPQTAITLDKLQVLRFELPFEKFIGQRAVVPRITGEYKGAPLNYGPNPPTLVDPSIRTSMMFWARSTNSSVKADTNAWSINGIAPGGTVNWHKANGYGLFRSAIKPRTNNVTSLRIMHNGKELYKLTQKTGETGRRLALPYPNGVLDFYWLEMENDAGERYQSAPVWVTADTRPGTVTVPIQNNGAITDISIEAARIPFFHYPCNTESGNMLEDISGYSHHGRLQRNGIVGYAYGSFGHTDYYHVHDGVTENRVNPLFQSDPDGRGYLAFHAADKNFYMISGGTAMPYASTYEIEFRPELNGATMFLMGSANNQINLYIDKDGYLTASRGGSVEGAAGTKPTRQFTSTVRSKTPVKNGIWQKAAVVYDLKNLSLYLDGALQGQTATAPVHDHESIDHLTVASRCGFLHNPGAYFNGGIRNLRIYGRNLSPAEFLK